MLAVDKFQLFVSMPAAILADSVLACKPICVYLCDTRKRHTTTCTFPVGPENRYVDHLKTYVSLSTFAFRKSSQKATNTATKLTMSDEMEEVSAYLTFWRNIVSN